MKPILILTLLAFNASHANQSMQATFDHAVAKYEESQKQNDLMKEVELSLLATKAFNKVIEKDSKSDLAKKSHEYLEKIGKRTEKIMSGIKSKQRKRQASAESKYKTNGCRMLSSFHVKKNMGNGIYQISYRDGGFKYGACARYMRNGGCSYRRQIPTYSDALLGSTTNFKSTGRVSVMYVAEKGTQEIELSNGFKKSVPLFIESPKCKELRGLANE